MKRHKRDLWGWWLVVYFLILGATIYLLAGCIPIAAYNYVTHDVSCEARQSDWERTHSANDPFTEPCNQRGIK